MDKEYKKEFFKELLEDLSWKKERAIFDRLLGKPIWWLAEEKRKSSINRQKDETICSFLSNQKANQSLCLQNLLATFDRVEKSCSFERFICHLGLPGLALPIARGGNIYGYIGLCHIKKTIPEDILSLFAAFTETIVEDIQRQLELSKLYDTIRPRAIALSTVHTVHRLISSTLDLHELLPRIARLSLQVLRARRCSIMLLDGTKRYLIPKATVDLKDRKVKLGKLKIGEGIQGKVARDGNSIFRLSYLSIPLLEEEKVMGVITVWDKLNRKPFTLFDQEILTTLTEQAVIAIKNAQLYKEQERLTIGSIKSLATILDTKALSPYAHSTAFIDIVMAIAEEMNITKDQSRSLYYAALLHDAGRVAIPEEILTKPSALTGRELKIIKRHPIKGAQIIKPLEVLKPVIPIILHHHERYDGTGYPDRLKKNRIPLGARIMAVADAFEAMVYKRPYRKLMTISQAVAEIIKHSGAQFDPEVVKAFLRVSEKGKLKSILKSCRGM